MTASTVYENIIMKLESVYLNSELEVDEEIAALMNEHQILDKELNDLKIKIEVLNSLKRSFELYGGHASDLDTFRRSLFDTLCDKQIVLRLLQEKELLLQSYLLPIPDMQLPTVIGVNKEYKLRKRVQEVEFISSFLSEHKCFEKFAFEIEKADTKLDIAIETGTTDKLEEAVELFFSIYEKILNFSHLEEGALQELRDFRSKILLQAYRIIPFIPEDVASMHSLSECYKNICEEVKVLELEVNKLLYQFAMFQQGKKMILLEIKQASGELESVIFKDYSFKQKIQTLQQIKIDLNAQKENFLKDPSFENYTEAMKNREEIENRFRRLMVHKTFEKTNLLSRFFNGTKHKASEDSNQDDENRYSKVLFQVLHNSHITSQDKLSILRLAKQSKLITANSGKFFYQRFAKTQTVQNMEKIFKDLSSTEIH